MGRTESLRGQQAGQSREDLSSIRRKIEIVRAACEAASDALDMLGAIELKVLMRSPDFERDLDFYELVRNFETNLIRRALHHTNGIQVQAARLLNIKKSTLNNKIKVYDIQQEPRFLSIAPKATNRRGGKKTRDNLVA
jgi:DNA-binding NtrC family response regulator